jgi:hypothetical protein
MPPSKFLKFSMPPPPPEFGIEGVQSEFSLIIDTICSSSRCLIYVMIYDDDLCDLCDDDLCDVIYVMMIYLIYVMIYDV